MKRSLLSRRWVWRPLLGFCVLAFVIWLAPIVAAWTPLVSWLCARAAKPINGSIHVSSTSLGWFSPVRLYGVEVRDADGRVIVHVTRVESDRILLHLLLNQDDLGSIRLDHPTIDLTLGKSDSNLERLLKKPVPDSGALRSADPPSRFNWPEMRLEVVNGVLNCHDHQTGETWHFRAVSMSALLANDEPTTVQMSVRGSTHDGTEAGTLKADIQMQNLGQPNVAVSIKGRCTSFPAALAGVVARRYFPGTELHGSLQGQGVFEAVMKDGKPHVVFTGDVTANHVSLRHPALAEEFVIKRLRAPCTIRLEDRKLIVEHAELDSDFGKLSVHGSLDFAADWPAAFAQPDFDIAMELNVATLLERLPKTLHVHPDLNLTSGQLKLQFKSGVKDGAIVWQGQLHLSDVCGLKGEQAIEWSEPIALDFQVRNLHQGVPLIDHLKCTSRFLHIEGSSTADRFTLTADADLQRLAEPLGQFIDLAGVKLTGKAHGTIQVRRVEEENFLVQGDAQLKQLNLTGFTGHSWQEESAAATLAARGHRDKAGRVRIDSADADVKLGSDRIKLKLSEPILDVAGGSWGTHAVSLDGDLTRWRNRARCWTTLLDDWQLAGQADVQLQVHVSSQVIACKSANVVAINVRLTGPGVWIQEPTLHLQAAARWDLQSGDLDLTQLKLACPTVALAADRLSVQPASRSLHGSVKVTGDLARLRKWKQDPKSNLGVPITGAFVAQIDLRSNPDRSMADFDLSLKNFVYGHAANPTWREADLKCSGRGVYLPAKDALELERLKVVSATLSVDVKGTLANLTNTQDIDLVGTLAYDLEKMEPQLRQLLGKDVKLAGKDGRAFQLAGPLFAKGALTFKELKGNAGLHWTSLKALGCDVGPADLKAVLQQGWLQVHPVETTLNGGKLRLQPNLKLEPDPVEIILVAGPMIEKAKITPQMCSGAIGHALPLLANVSEADGSISLTLEGGRVPLSAPTSSEIKGTLILHHAKVGPNPIIRELSGLLKIAAPTGVVKECKVPFHLANGKVHHSNLEMALGDFTLTSSGEVGLDGSLAIVIEMPIPLQLAAAARLTPAQAKQIVRIPIGGTLEHPRVDPRALESLSAALGRSLLENQLNRLRQPNR